VSESLSVRSLGSPYFAAVQSDLAYMDALGGGAEFTLELEFALYALPTQSASADELHPLLSYHGAESAGAEILTVGVTPSGRIKVIVPGGGAYSVAGLLAPDGKFRTLILTYTTAGTVSVTLDAAVVSLTTTGSPTGSPATGINRFMLFNGRAGLTRCDCAIRRALWGDENGSLEWRIAEGFGYALAEAHAHPDFLLQNFGLVMQVFTAFYASPWGAQEGDVTAAFRWQVETEYEEIPLPETVYEEGAFA
jgi:hypothetical protein